MILPIYLYGQPVLRKVAADIEPDYPELQELIKNMFETMWNAEGIGLAAPQIGVSKRIIVIDVGEGPITLINPVIVYKKGAKQDMEGCLSVPGRQGYTHRPMHVKVEALNRDGEKVTLEGEGLLARAFCHEIDHLDGKLFIDEAVHVLTKEEIAELFDEE